MVYIKIHKSYRDVIAVCDENLIGKKFEEGKMQIEITETFFKGKLVEEKEAESIINEMKKEDATFNIAGQRSINLFLKMGLVSPEGIKTIQGIPVALILL